MARAKKKSSKKKAAKKSKKKTKKKSSRKASSRTHSLIEVPDEEWALKWSPRRTSCRFKHVSGIGGPLGCGVTDHVHLYTDGYRIFVISINYGECYACAEVFDQNGCAAICFLGSDDCATIHKMNPDKIAQMLASRI